MEMDYIDRIVDAVVSRLLKWRDSYVHCAYEEALPNKSTFLTYGRIYVTGLPAYLLATETFEHWLSDGVALGCDITIGVEGVQYELWPVTPFLKRCVHYEDGKGRVVFSLPESHVTATAIRELPVGAVLLLAARQRLTALAAEEAQSKQIKVVQGGI